MAHSAAATSSKSRFLIPDRFEAIAAAKAGLPLGAAELCAIKGIKHGRFYELEKTGAFDHLRLPNSDHSVRRFSGVKIWAELSNTDPIIHGHRPVPRRGLRRK